METWERIEAALRHLILVTEEVWDAIKQLFQPTAEEVFQELSELASEVDRTATQTERKRENTPYKPKFKPLRRDKRLTIQRCRSHCATDKTHKITRKSSFVLSIPKEGKSRYNYYVITVLALLFHKNRISLSQGVLYRSGANTAYNTLF